jgi:hypothetical protein
MKVSKIVAFPRPGNDLSKVVTYLLIEGTAFTLRKGLSTLKILSAFKFIPRFKKSITL